MPNHWLVLFSMNLMAGGDKAKTCYEVNRFESSASWLPIFFFFLFFFGHFFLVIITTTSMTSFSSCPRFYWVFLPSFPVCHLGFIGFYSGSTRLYWVLPGFPLFSWVLPGFTTLYLDFSHFAVINGFHLEFTWLWGDYWVFFLGFHLVFFWRHQEQNSKKEEPNEKNRRKRKKKEQQQQQQQQQQQ